MITRQEHVPFYQKPAFKTIIASALAVLAGLVIGLIIMLVSNPGNAFPGFGMMVGGVFTEGIYGIGRWLELLPPLLLCGLGVGLSFKAGLFNIGASGQYTTGLFCALLVGIFGESLGGAQWIVAVLAGLVGGAVWGFIPGFFKAVFNINEVITSIMFNYIGMYMVNTIITGSSDLYLSIKSRTQTIDVNAMTPTLGLDKVFGSNVDLTLILAILIAILMWVILNKTTFGFELKAAGSNRDAAKYSGVNEKKSIILTMTIAGALCGLGGAFYILKAGINNVGVAYTPVNVVSNVGFDGIVVALLGNSHPIGTVFSTLLITFLQRGGYYSQRFGFKEEIIDIIIAVIIYFAAFSLLIGTKFLDMLKKRREKKLADSGITIEETTEIEQESEFPEIDEILPDEILPLETIEIDTTLPHPADENGGE